MAKVREILKEVLYKYPGTLKLINEQADIILRSNFSLILLTLKMVHRILFHQVIRLVIYHLQNLS